MPAPQSTALDVLAAQLADALDVYEAEVARMLATWPDLEAYRRVSQQSEQVRRYCSSLPLLRAQWMELLIAHAELVHFLWRLQYGNRDDARAQIEGVRENHAGRVAALRQRCLQLAARPRRGEAS